MSLIEIKDFNTLIDNKQFFNQPLKIIKKCIKSSLKCQGMMIIQPEILNYLYHQNHYKLIGIDLSRQSNANIAQQINFTERFEEDHGAVMFFTAEKQKEKHFNFFFTFINCHRII